MKARCVLCNNAFDYRNQRGNKLSNHLCKCGGKYEQVSSDKVYGESPMPEIAETITPFPTWPDQRKYFHAFINRKGVRFILDYKQNKFFEVTPSFT